MNETPLGRKEHQQSIFTFTLQHPAGQCSRAGETTQTSFTATSEHEARILAENSCICDLCTARYRVV